MKNIILLITGLTFLTLKNDAQTVKDIDGNFYNTITIGNQVWMKENLKVTKFKNGKTISFVTDNTEWNNLTTPAYCWYNNDTVKNKDTYGALYNWYAVTTEKLCPKGWHVPTDAEWTILTDYLGGYTVVGGKLKEAKATHWGNPNTGATDSSGFTALPGGRRGYLDGSFGYLCYHGYFWSATETGSPDAWYRVLFYDDTYVGRYYDHKTHGFSVRCLKD